MQRDDVVLGPCTCVTFRAAFSCGSLVKLHNPKTRILVPLTRVRPYPPRGWGGYGLTRGGVLACPAACPSCPLPGASLGLRPLTSAPAVFKSQMSTVENSNDSYIGQSTKPLPTSQGLGLRQSPKPGLPPAVRSSHLHLEHRMLQRHRARRHRCRRRRQRRHRHEHGARGRGGEGGERREGTTSASAPARGAAGAATTMTAAAAAAVTMVAGVVATAA